MFRFCKEHWFFLVAACDMKHEYALKFWEDMFIVMEGPSLPGWLEQWSPLLPPDKENIRRWKFDWRNLVSPYFHLFSSFRGGCFLQQVCAKVCHCRGVEKEKGGVELWAEKGCFILKQVFLLQNSASQHFKGKLLYFHPVGWLSHFVTINSMSIEARNKIYSGEPLVTLGQIAVSCKWLK